MHNDFLPSRDDILEKGDDKILEFPSFKQQQNTNLPQKNLKRQIRRVVKQNKTKNLKKTISTLGYNPWPGYIVVAKDGKSEYVRYMRSSKRRVFLKKQTNRRTRRKELEEICSGKSNGYRRYLDFWWELF